MTLERGKAYVIDLKSPAICINCKNDITHIANGSVLVYLGKLDTQAQDLFIYDKPPECPYCHHIYRYHIENFVQAIDVTGEFQKLLDK